MENFTSECHSTASYNERVMVITLTVPTRERDSKVRRTACDDVNMQVHFCGYIQRRYPYRVSHLLQGGVDFHKLLIRECGPFPIRCGAAFHFCRQNFSCLVAMVESA